MQGRLGIRDAVQVPQGRWMTGSTPWVSPLRLSFGPRSSRSCRVAPRSHITHIDIATAGQKPRKGGQGRCGTTSLLYREGRGVRILWLAPHDCSDGACRKHSGAARAIFFDCGLLQLTATWEVRAGLSFATAVLPGLPGESAFFGDKEAGCPDNIHERALVWTREPVIRRTTPTKRQRNHTASLVACPAEMLPLVAWGYVSPNYPWPPWGLSGRLGRGGRGRCCPAEGVTAPQRDRTILEEKNRGPCGKRRRLDGCQVAGLPGVAEAPMWRKKGAQNGKGGAHLAGTVRRGPRRYTG